MELLDTDVLIDVQRGHPPAVAWFGQLSEIPSVPGYVIMELIQDARNAREVQEALKLTAPLPIIWPTESDCARALADFAAFHLSHGLGLIDSLVAASSIGRSATLCSFNAKHYRPIRGLTIVQPYAR